jgi:hypothetical protein
MSTRWRHLRIVAVAGSALALAACATTGQVQQQIAGRMDAGDYAGAIELVESERDGAFDGKNELLYYMELGMLLHVDGRYADSNEAFERAKRIGDALYTRSLTNEGVSLLTNDYALDYAGENFERTLIHLFAALNYLQLDERDSALVEIRQVGEYLRKLQIDSTNENVYQEDAFARYLSALLYESGGELDSAFVDYKKAVAAYEEYETEFAVRPPESLLPNAERVASRLGGWAERELAELGGDVSPRVLPPGAGEVVLLHYNGLVPIKGQDKYSIPFSEAWLFYGALQAAVPPQDRASVRRAVALSSQIRGIDLVSVAFPKFVDRPYTIARMQPIADDALEITRPELVEDIGAIAKKDLADRIVRIRTKTIARAAIKYALQKGLEQAARQAKDDDVSSLLAVATQITGNIARYATEQADQRSWSTLPDEIWMASVVLPEGRHDLSVDFLNAQQVVVESRRIPAVEVAGGQRRFVIVRTVR